MERIEEAIAKARAERAGRIGQTPAAEARVDRVEMPAGKAERTRIDEDTPARISGRDVIPNPIEYTVTQVVELDSKALARNRVIAGQNDDARAESYRHLRTHVLQTLTKNNWRSLAITSAFQSAGKTLTSVNLSISLAQELNQTVLLVDLDLKKPDTHNALGIKVEKGIIDCIQSAEPVENVLINPGLQRLVLLPGRATGRDSSELLTSPKMMSLLREIRTRYESRIIIFDLPPLLRNDDALVFTPYADATLLVVEEGFNTKDDVESSMHLLSSTNMIGTILNKAR